MASATVEKARKGQGREERKNSPAGQLRAPNLNALYTRHLRDIEAGDFDFRVVLVRPELSGDARTTILDRTVLAINWTEETAVLSGSLTLRRPSPLAVKSLPIKEYHRIRLLVRWGGEWYRLWELRVNNEPTPTGTSGEMVVDLTDELAALRQNERDWEFKKSKHRPKGWSPEEIVRYVARKEGVQLGKIAKGKTRIKKLKMHGSGLDVIMRAYAHERRATNRKFVVRFRNGKLEIVPVERHEILYEIKGVLIDSNIEVGSRKKKRPTTLIEAKGRIGKKKIEVKVFRRPALKRLGLSTAERSYGKVDSKKELKDEAMRDLADELLVNRKATLQIPGIPFIERGDTVHWDTDEPGWSGPSKGTHDRGFAYVTGVTHTVNPGDFQSTVTISQHDPFLADAEKQAEEDRAAKKPNRDKNRKKKGEESE